MPCYLKILFFCPLFLYSQKKDIDSVIKIHGGMDCYIGAQLNDFKQKQIPLFVSHNQLGGGFINLALLELSYTPTKNLRVQLSPGFGSYMNANYASENKNLRWIYEGYLGIKTSKKGTDWIDVGVFSSPYTYEFAKSWEQSLFTRSLAPEYVPYYLLGLRYKRKINTNLSLTTFLLNGWQHLEIQRKTPSLGTQLEYTKKKNYINWTSYQGNEKNVAQPNFGYRFFTEMSWIYTTNKFKLFACGYTGMQLISVQAKFWGQVHFAGEFQLIKKLLVNARIEQFLDPNNIQIRQGSNHGFNCSGLSLGLHAKVTDFLSLRLESRLLLDNSKTGGFIKEGQQTQLLPLGFIAVQLKF